MREQRQVSEWILGCQWRLGLMFGCTKDLFCHRVVDVITELAREDVLSELCML